MRKPSQRFNRSCLACVLVVASACSRDTKATKADTTSSGTAGGSVATTDTAPADTTTPKNLAATRWRLIEIQPVGSTQVVTRPNGGGEYTISFDSEGGFLVMQLDCNRVTGPYADKPDRDKRGGSLNIGPLKVTRAQCPSPSLGDRLAHDVTAVRSYRFAKGRLSLVADSGVYVWARNPRSLSER